MYMGSHKCRQDFLPLTNYLVAPEDEIDFDQGIQYIKKECDIKTECNVL